MKPKFLLLFTLVYALCCQGQDASLPFQNASLSFEQRVNDLVGRLTLPEKVGQMLNAAPAIDRLHIPAYDWWNEVLHGVARTTFKVTVYPQAIAMAANFDTASLHTMAEYSALEGRAIYNESIRQGKAGQRYTGLTYWTPNINIFRDPRWGRGQETYGEDPFLTASLGKSFVRGLQGNDPKYLLAAACAKHYAVHSGPEPSRHVFDVSPTDYDLWDTYLPAFRELVTNAKVAGVMCAYNAFKGQPCCGSDLLLTDILRNQWGFKGYVTSDCGAIDDFFTNHKTHADAASASADAVLHGTDIDCGNYSYKALVDAVKQGKITEAQIDVSLKRLFMIRFRLGMFDNPSLVKYAATPATELESPAHKAHSLKMARQSIVLLKNSNAVLPLSGNIKKIAVLGPNADNAISILGNYNGTPSEVVTALQGIRNRAGSKVQVSYEAGTTFTNDSLLAYTDISNECSWEGQKGFKAEYFNNRDLSGTPVFTNMENSVDHQWQEGEIVTGTLKALNFSARYSTDYKPTADGKISFELNGDDGYRFSVNGREEVNAWTRNRWGTRTWNLNMEKGKTYRLVLEYFQAEGKAGVSLKAGHFEKNDFKAVATRVKDADAIIFVGGISPQLEGEEMKVDNPGFNGGDRTSILLPAVQTELMKALVSTGKPVIFVMMTGSALAIPWEAEHVPAIVNAWYAGQSAGTAIADVLFGDYNPSGRLPVTFYASDKDLPGFEDYNMENRTYRYFKGKPLYPFGFGLGYSSFAYTWKSKPKNAFTKADNIACTVSVANTGGKDGDEVVQAYVEYPQTGHRLPLKELRQFKRETVNRSASKDVVISIPVASLMKWSDKTKKLELPAGVYHLAIGGNSEDRKLYASFTVK